MTSLSGEDEFIGALSAEVAANSSPSAAAERVLDQMLQRLTCVAGTVHFLEPETQLLKLIAHRGMPPFVVEKITSIPVGKGMAGIAAQRREAVQVCNLQTDESGVVRPGARDTKMEGSVAVPMLGADGALRGTLGVAKPVPYDFTPAECELLLRAGRLLAERVQP